MSQYRPYRVSLRTAATTRLCSPRSSFPLRTGKSFLQARHSGTSATPSEYAYIEEVEPLREYRADSYHPVRINDRLNHRYQVVHKLGHGTFSTAWLAVHEESRQYVAVKVGTADAERTEVDILSHLTQDAASHNDPTDQPSLIPVVLDRFDLHGPNGVHPCLVTHPARCSLRDARDACGNGLFQLDVGRSLAAQLTLALCLIHSRGYAHGDLHFGNLLLHLPASLNKLSIEQLYSQYGEPDRQPVIRLDTQQVSSSPEVPPYAVTPVWLGLASDEFTLVEAQLILSDFGVAFQPQNKSQFESYTPLTLRPPEALFEPQTPLTFASDIWSLGCVIFELLAHRPLLDGFFATQDYITAQQVTLQGMMPPEWWGRWEERGKWFDDRGDGWARRRSFGRGKGDLRNGCRPRDHGGMWRQ